MSGRDADIRRLNELTGGSVEFREFGPSMGAGSSDWGLLNAVSRSVDSGNPLSGVSNEETPVVCQPAQTRPPSADWSMLTSIGMPPAQLAEAKVFAEPASERLVPAGLEPTVDANAAKANFGHLFRKSTPNPSQDIQRTDLVQLLKAISRCP